MSETPKNKIKYGLKNAYYAIATIAADGTATYASPVRIPGAVSLSMEPQGDREPFYADDVEYYVSISNTGYEGTLEMALMPESFEKDVLKAVEDSKHVYFEEVSPEIVHFALLFQFAGDVHATRHCLYNCTAMRPKVEGETKSENIEPKTEELSLRAGSIYNSTLQKDIVKAKTKSDTDSTVYNAWFTTVQLPTAAQ
jgi:phi13 family phage major tail protein